MNWYEIVLGVVLIAVSVLIVVFTLVVCVLSARL